MQANGLTPHPASPASKVKAVTFRFIRLHEGKAMLRFRVDDASGLILPEFKGRGRADELWQATCFELFLRGEGTGYREFNFSPSGQWAAYDFAGEREGMTEYEPIITPEITVEQGPSILVGSATFDAKELAGFTHAGISAVIEEEGSIKSYWALAHPSEKPDFHHPACFAAALEPPLHV